MTHIEMRKKLLAIALATYKTAKYIEFTEGIQQTDLSEGKKMAMEAHELVAELLKHY